MIELHMRLLAGAAAGALRSFLGWLDSDAAFSPRLFAATVVRTTVMGAVIAFGGSLDPVSTFFFVYTSDAVINKGYKIGNKLGSD